MLALRAGVHDDTVTSVGDAALGVAGRVELEVDDLERAVGLEDHLAEAEGVAVAVGAGVGRLDPDDLGAVEDVDEHAVLAEAAGAVLEGGVAGQGHRRDVGVPADGDLLELAGTLGVAAVTDGTLGGHQQLVAVGGTHVDLPAVVVADQGLEVVVLVAGRPAVLDRDRGGGRLRQADLLALLQADRAGLRGGGGRGGRRRCLVLLLAEAESHDIAPSERLSMSEPRIGDGTK